MTNYDVYARSQYRGYLEANPIFKSLQQLRGKSSDEVISMLGYESIFSETTAFTK